MNKQNKFRLQLQLLACLGQNSARLIVTFLLSGKLRLHITVPYYRVIHKKVAHEIEDKMHGKIKMILQKDEDLAHIKQQYSDRFSKKIDFKSAFLVAFRDSICHFVGPLVGRSVGW